MRQNARAKVREITTTVLELVAGLIVAGGVAMIYLPAGVVTAGAALFGISYLIQRNGGQRR